MFHQAIPILRTALVFIVRILRTQTSNLRIADALDTPNSLFTFQVPFVSLRTTSVLKRFSASLGGFTNEIIQYGSEPISKVFTAGTVN